MRPRLIKLVARDREPGEGDITATNWLEKCAPERIRTTNLLIRSQMLYPVELRAPEREELICGAGSERQMKLERSEYDGLLIYCLRLRFGKEVPAIFGAKLALEGSRLRFSKGEDCGALEPAFAVEHESPTSECGAPK
jgi:hypothetical protein